MEEADVAKTSQTQPPATTTPTTTTSSGGENDKPYQANWLKGASNPFKPSKNLLAAVNAANAATSSQFRYVNPRFKGGNGRFYVDPRFSQQQQIYSVKLTFAGEEFDGEGATLQLAKHNAASRALEFFSNTENFLKAKSLAESSSNKTAKAYRPPQLLAAAAQQQQGSI